ncbi:hypothetical protein RHCRD62_60095 [Rhodococcus sp. RD6.2]|nr:hypothetical protein RHCRD62_60095 [Rhodococcus sp. RD6.2]
MSVLRRGPLFVENRLPYVATMPTTNVSCESGSDIDRRVSDPDTVPPGDLSDTTRAAPHRSFDFRFSSRLPDGCRDPAVNCEIIRPTGIAADYWLVTLAIFDRTLKEQNASRSFLSCGSGSALLHPRFTCSNRAMSANA